jgi:hypothetical protein
MAPPANQKRPCEHTHEDAADGYAEDEEIAADGVVVGAPAGGEYLYLGVEAVPGQGLQHPRRSYHHTN